jgi:site-specific recombinase XerC
MRRSTSCGTGTGRWPNKATGDVLAVSRLMGHANLNTTAIYAGANDEVAARIADAVSA